MDITWISCDSLHAWLQTQSRVLAVASSSIARRWVRPQTEWRLWRKALIGGMVPDAWL